jgi:hypothetical protein
MDADASTAGLQIKSLDCADMFDDSGEHGFLVFLVSFGA